ncbi:nuclear transport factor 2 family protein [Nocardia goodfellowii]|uniref:SnoaL-like aldol condensation-catalyzing enzyme n=1 Tax=Nocardia goodfellowii TaxID=882446 RepID=A0ABS4QGH9_9NOCA|nr:nuclear transport factor 2 family protein [Nocardia goodfellowii]MBP2190799.1 putative SnoaL-like aldol condensation-catalyzing enzyme [Nocardia goodfellowii]
MTNETELAPVETAAQRNKNLVLHGLAEFAAGNIEILRELLDENFIEHSPGNPSGRDAFIEFTANAPVARARLDIKRVIADDQYAVVHYLMTAPGDARGTAVIDVWRLVDGRIVEHWDVVQPVPDAEQIPHGMV